MAKIDLNLLFTLQTLLKVKSTTLAAKELNTSQSAISRSLLKLRELIGDEILVRNGQKLELTVRGEELAHEVPYLMSQTNSLFAPKEFIPATCKEKLTVAMNASIAEWLVPPFIQLLSQQASKVELTIEDWESSTPDSLDKKETRIGVNYFPIELPKSFIQRKVGKDDFVLVCRTDHPLSQLDYITFEDIKSQSFAFHIMKDWNDDAPKAERVFKQNGLEMNVHLRCRHISIILKTILESDMVFFCSSLAAKQFDERFVAVPLDKNLDTPTGDIGLFYSNQYTSDPITKWLESLLRKAIKAESA
ncbi:LysR family transcriptional regulator [Vibrio sp.]|uniref:LysR family transcriptional regulator n=1 Tax=Vibrio sp. TaxID=678 RepID=UPI00378DEE1A